MRDRVFLVGVPGLRLSELLLEVVLVDETLYSGLIQSGLAIGDCFILALDGQDLDIVHIRTQIQNYVVVFLAGLHLLDLLIDDGIALLEEVIENPLQGRVVDH